MKPIINKSSLSYIEKLSDYEKEGVLPTLFFSHPDALDLLIEKERLQIRKLFFDTDLDIMLIVLSNKKVLNESITKYQNLSNASLKQLQSYKISPMGVHWPKLNEDLSLKGLLESTFYKSVAETA